MMSSTWKYGLMSARSGKTSRVVRQAQMITSDFVAEPLVKYFEIDDILKFQELFEEVDYELKGSRGKFVL